jgi:hypothetical protein
MKWFTLCVVFLAAAVGPARAEAQAAVYRTTPSADVSLPFWCDWGYDWDERCYRDFSDRLSVGGDDDKVWRSALRFPLAALPPGSTVFTATLSASFDGVCLGPRKTQMPCPARAFTIDAHPIFSSDWLHEREVDVGPVVDRASFWTGAPRRLSWDVTDLVAD